MRSMWSSSACDRTVVVGWGAVVVVVTVEFGAGVCVTLGCAAGGWVRAVVVAGARVTAGWVCCCSSWRCPSLVARYFPRLILPVRHFELGRPAQRAATGLEPSGH